MTLTFNEYGQPVGPALPDWQAPAHPVPMTLHGRVCKLEPLNVQRHAEQLFAANALDDEGRSWTYLPYGPFTSYPSYCAWLEASIQNSDTLFFAIIDQATEKAVGVASYLRITPISGSIEVGHLHYSNLLKQTPAATEAMFLLMQHAFELGYRRYEWKCNALNAASRAAALRLGFTFEGIFRQAAVVKGHNRDTAWYSIIDSEWPALRAGFLRWLAAKNFDESGRQIKRLGDVIRSIP